MRCILTLMLGLSWAGAALPANTDPLVPALAMATTADEADFTDAEFAKADEPDCGRWTGGDIVFGALPAGVILFGVLLLLILLELFPNFGRDSSTKPSSPAQLAKPAPPKANNEDD